MHPCSRLLVSTAAIALSLGSSANAQTATVELDTVVVEGAARGATDFRLTGRGDRAGRRYVARATTTGSKTSTPLAELPQSVSVIGREEFEDRGAQKVDEALRYNAGVFTQPFGSDSDTDWFYIRGFDATQTGVYLDGLNLYQYGFAGSRSTVPARARRGAAWARIGPLRRLEPRRHRQPDFRSARRASGSAMSRDR